MALKDTVFICAECGKNIRGDEIKGTIRHPYCKECFKKVWNDDYGKYFEFLRTEKGE